jgi:outer membrane protein TolC
MKFARYHFSPVAPVAALALAVASLSAQPAAQTPVPDQLDLKTAIGFALENNFAIRQARERIKQQEGVVLEVSARTIPNVSAGGTAERVRLESSSASADDDSWTINISASQTLYAGGGVRSNVRSSRLAREAAILDLQATINDALLQVRTGFYSVLLAREKITVQEKNLELLKQQLKTTTDRFDAGTVSSFEKLRAQVAVANAQVPLITAKNDYRLAIEALRQALGFTTNRQDSIRKIPDFTGSLNYTPVSFDLQAAFDAAHANRPDLQRLAKLTAAREESVTAAKAGYYPTVSAIAGWQRGKTPSLLFKSAPAEQWVVGLQSQWNIFDGRATSGRVTQARSVLEQTKLSLTEAQLAAEVEVRRAFSNWQQATELADAMKLTVEQAEEAVRLANARYGAGTATQLDVLQAQTDLTTARTNQIQAYYTYTVAVASLRKAMGQADEFVTK